MNYTRQQVLGSDGIATGAAMIVLAPFVAEALLTGNNDRGQRRDCCMKPTVIGRLPTSSVRASWCMRVALRRLRGYNDTAIEQVL
jgi:hypothetical protein